MAVGYLSFRNSHSQMFIKIDVLRNLAIFTGKHRYWSLFLIKLQVFSYEICEIFRTPYGCFWNSFLHHYCYFGIKFWIRSHRRCSVKKGVLRNFTKFTGKHLCQSLFVKKENFSCEFCEISKNTFFTEHLWVTASKVRRLPWWFWGYLALFMKT